MNNKKNENPYATNKGGRITAPNKTAGDPAAVKITGSGDLRARKGK